MATMVDRFKRQAKKIDCLVDQRYGPRSSATVSGSGADEEREEYEEALWRQTEAVVDARYDSVRREEQFCRVANIRAGENDRFFNQPHAKADVAYWSKAAHWTLDEAVALSLGKSPELVSWEWVEPYLGISDFAREYGRVRELALRALAAGQLIDRILPGSFIAWAKDLDISFPDELEAAVRTRGGLVGDRKTAYDKLKEQYDDLGVKFAEAERAASEVRDNSDTLRRKVEELQAQIAATPKEKSLGTRERETLLKMIIGIAGTRYGYDASKGRNEATAKIARDLERAGLPLDSDTILKWLREGSSLLPPKIDP